MGDAWAMTGSLSEVPLYEEWQIAEKMVMFAIKQGEKRPRKTVIYPLPCPWSEHPWAYTTNQSLQMCFVHLNFSGPGKHHFTDGWTEIDRYAATCPEL